MDNSEIIRIAMCQSALDSNCDADDFCSQENRVVISQKNSGARKYLELPFCCDLTSYGNNIVASTSQELKGEIEKYINKYGKVHCFETPNLYMLNDKLKPFDSRVCFMAEYFLPDVNILRPLSCDYGLKLLMPDEFQQYYTDEWSNALCESRKQLDVLAVGAFDKGRLIGLAGCSADCDTMWQIGVDVLAEYRNRGIASAVTSRLAVEILKRGIVPFYCCAWSNIGSARNAVKSGFRQAWVQITAKSNSVIANMIK